MNNKELKKQISKLRKLKNKMRPNSSERIELHRRIREMKLQLEQKQIIDKDKQIYIDQLIELESTFSLVDLSQYTTEQLKKTIEKRKKCGGNI